MDEDKYLYFIARKDDMIKTAGEQVGPIQDDYRFPYYINPLLFQEYDEEKILELISDWGGKAPEDTDANSTNCLLNSLGNEVPERKFGYNPYGFELSNLVRGGYLDHSSALRKVDASENPQVVALVRKKLGLA